MLDAIWEARVHRFTAEVKIWLAGVAHGPFADLFGKVEQARLIGNFRAGLGGHKAARRRRRNRGLLIARALAQKATGAYRNNAWLV